MKIKGSVFIICLLIFISGCQNQIQLSKKNSIEIFNSNKKTIAYLNDKPYYVPENSNTIDLNKYKNKEIFALYNLKGCYGAIIWWNPKVNKELKKLGKTNQTAFSATYQYIHTKNNSNKLLYREIKSHINNITYKSGISLYLDSFKYYIIQNKLITNLEIARIDREIKFILKYFEREYPIKTTKGLYISTLMKDKKLIDMLKQGSDISLCMYAVNKKYATCAQPVNAQKIQYTNNEKLF